METLTESKMDVTYSDIFENETLTSLDCANFLSWSAYHKYKTVLNRTQIQNLLYIWYGLFLAKTDDKLFKDDSPKARPFGPVFPRVYRQFNEKIPKTDSLSIKAIDKKKFALDILLLVVEKYHNLSAEDLTRLSLSIDSPWFKTVYGEGASENSDVNWNINIKEELIKEYFKKVINNE